jgi:hypothetical protein
MLIPESFDGVPIVGNQDPFGLQSAARQESAAPDGIAKEFGLGLYRRMMRDPVVGSSIEAFQIAILADPMEVSAAIDSPLPTSPSDETSEFERASEFADFIRQMFSNLADEGMSFETLGYSVLDALAYGHSCVEKLPAFDDENRLVWKRLRPLAPGQLGFIRSDTDELLGYVTRGKDFGLSGGLTASVADPVESTPGFIHPDRIARFTFGGGGNPQGESLLEGAYNPWHAKTQTLPELHTFCKLYGLPFLVVMAAPNAHTQVDLRTGKTYMELMRDQLAAARQNSFAVMPHGADVKWIQQSGDGGALINPISYHDRQISLAILGTTRLNQEAQFGSKADSGTAFDLFQQRVNFARKLYSDFITKTLILPLMIYNFGEEGRRLCPVARFKGSENLDSWVRRVEALGQVEGLGLPSRFSDGLL